MVVTRRSTPAELLVARLNNVLGARGVALRELSSVDVIASVGVVPDRLLEQNLEPAGGLNALVRAQSSPAGPRSVVPVHDEEGDVVGLIDVLHAPPWTPGPRSSAAMRVFARLAGPLVVARLDGRVATEDQIVLEGGRAITELALNAEDYESVLGGVLAVVNGLIECEKVGIAMVNEFGYLQALPGSFGAEPALVASSQVLLHETPTAAAAVFRSGRTMIANDPRRDIPLFLEWVHGFGIERLMTMPMVVAGSRRGVIHMANKSTDFTRGDARRAERIGAFVAGAVEQVRQRLEMSRKEALAIAVSRAATAVASGDRLEDTPVFLDDLMSVLSASVITVKHGDGHAPIVVRGSGDDAAVYEFMESVSVGETAERTSMSRPPAPGELGWATLQTPILVDGEPIATLAVLRVPCVPFSSDESAAIRRMANIIALAVTTDRYRREQAEASRMREYQEIADDIHDHVAQTLFSGKLTLESALSEMDATASARPAVLRARDLIVRSEVSIRDMIHRLAATATSPSDLVPDLRDIAADVQDQFGIPVDVHVDPTRMDVASGLRSDLVTALLAASREALVNAAKHAQPSRIELNARVNRQRRFVLTVVDDGLGIESYTPGFGLEATRRKLEPFGLSFDLRANRTGGSSFSVEIPLQGMPGD